ncbi:MAG: tetratricopeptide repeat protein [Chloroflexota bacterium]|nr:tetratricopeptide repeat protein [Chloroflexota bacterium]
MNKVADIYESLGKYQPAEALYQRALTGAEQALGPDHPDVALFLNNLAFLADTQEHYQQAEPLYQRALNIYERALGHSILLSRACSITWGSSSGTLKRCEGNHRAFLAHAQDGGDPACTVL